MKYFTSNKPALINLISTTVIVSLFSFLFLMMLFIHLHVLPDGRIILHSHAIPFTGDKETSHTHSQTSLLFLHIFQSGLLLFFYAVIEFVRKIRIGKIYMNKKKLPSLTIFTFLYGLRAPPALSFSAPL
jgi:hypothetical protein